MKTDQKSIFIKKEGDEWFQRNKARMDRGEDVDLKLIKNLVKPNSRILEIGSSLGHRLNFLHDNYKVRHVYGIDPSRKAIGAGKKKYPNVNLEVGTADALPFKDDSFDFVIFGFCLYLVDRSLLFKVVAESDRVLKEGGFMLITDFDTPFPVRREYAHHKGMFSYKMDYSKLFTSSGHYFSVSKISYSHKAMEFDEDIQERIGTVLLHKEEYDKLYQKAKMPVR